MSGFDLPSNVYPEDSNIIDLVGTFFSGIWDGLDRCPVPGFSFSFADLFIALLTAGFIGLILKTAFHFSDPILQMDLSDIKDLKR